MKNSNFVCEQHNVRLDKFLSEKLTGWSRSQIQKMIREQRVLVNETAAAVHCFLKEKDRVVVMSEPKKTKALPKEKKIQVKTALEEIPLKIVFENENFLVVNKPAGLICHQYENIKEISLVDAVVQHCPSIKTIGDQVQRAGLVHRLDKDASGLIVFAKTQEAFVFFKGLFADRKIKKEYLALAHNKVINKTGEINFPISRSKTQRHKMAALPQNSEAGRQAITHYDLIAYYKNFSLLKVNIETGRTHQIRVHLNALGHPLAGDKVYTNTKIKKANLPRLFLHAYKLAFTYKDGTKYEFKSYLPLPLKQFLNSLTPRHKLFIVSGPSGVGKTTILRSFLKERAADFAPGTTYTTRQSRQVTEDKVLIYVSEPEFKQMVQSDNFLEWAKVHENYYGTDKQAILELLKKKHVLLNIDVQGAQTVLERIPEAYTVFIGIKNLDSLNNRLLRRSQLDDAELSLRLENAQKEMADSYWYDYFIYNEDNKLKTALANFSNWVLDISK